MDELSQQTIAGEHIEQQSFAFIDQQVGRHAIAPEHWEIVRRVIHTTGDFEFKDLLQFSADATFSAKAAIAAARPIVTDVTMIGAGLSQQRLAKYGLKTHCLINDPVVIAAAQRQGTTKAHAAIDQAAALGLLDQSIIAIGNAPTALLRLCDLVEARRIQPALIIGVPVGFIAAKESKERLLSLAGVPVITTTGYKGGSTIAVAIIHALIILTAKERP